MKKSASLLLPFAFCSVLLAQEGARDADAVLNRCGKPLKGDEIVYTNTISTRTLSYERGTLLFTRVGNDGWKFASATHKKQANLTAAEMATYMPCLPMGLADSASPLPLRKVTSVERIEVSMKHSLKQVIFYTLLFLVVLGLFFYLSSRRKQEDTEAYGA